MTLGLFHFTLCYNIGRKIRQNIKIYTVISLFDYASEK